MAMQVHPGMLKWVVIVAGVLAAGVVVVAVLAFRDIDSFDPAPPQDLTGAVLGDEGRVVFSFASCVGGPLEELRLATDRGVASDDELLWAAEATDGAATLAPSEVTVVEVGAAPAGMSEVVPLGGALPEGELLQFDAHFGGDGEAVLFFEFTELRPDEIFIGQGTYLSPEDFQAEAEGLCSSS